MGADLAMGMLHLVDIIFMLVTFMDIMSLDIVPVNFILWPTWPFKSSDVIS